MNRTWIARTAAAAVTTLGLGLGISIAATAAPPTPTPTPIASATVDAAVAKELTYMREEERLARDLYQSIAKLYPDNAAAFTRIASSEQRHFESVGLLLTRYGIADPAANSSVGTYADAGLTTAYADLLAKAKGSLTDAYGAGVTVETTDIADLKEILAVSGLPADVSQVLTRLLAGSQNHLATFTALAEGKTLGATDGTGMRNGRRWSSDATTGGTGTWTRGAGTGVGPANGQGYGRTGVRPATCPLR